MRPSLPGPVQAALALPFAAMVRRFGSRMRMGGQRLLVLTTIGAKSGRERQAVLGYWPDESERDGSVLIVGSNAGAARHAAWLFNMARNPDKVWIEGLGPRTLVRPETLEGEERAAAWAKVAATGAYRRYQDKTDREIPIVRLRPTSPA
jgi:deazaflavin-dependent nitroreductase family protein